MFKENIIKVRVQVIVSGQVANLNSSEVHKRSPKTIKTAAAPILLLAGCIMKHEDVGKWVCYDSVEIIVEYS